MTNDIVVFQSPEIGGRFQDVCDEKFTVGAT